MVRQVWLAAMLVAIGGCADHRLGQLGGPARARAPDVGELVAFQSNFAARSAESRSNECLWLQRRQSASPQAAWLLRLMIGRPLADACGEPSQLIRAYESLNASSEKLDGEVVGMAGYHVEILRRLAAESDNRRSPAAKSGKPPQRVNAKTNSDTRLREKIDAIRALEKALDESIEADPKSPNGRPK